jgi:hypothetical protein
MLAFTGIVLLFLAPGYIILGRRFQDDERLALSPAVSLLFYGAFGILLKLLGLPLSFIAAFTVLPLLLFWRGFTVKLSPNIIKVFVVALLMGYLTHFVSIHPESADGLYQITVAESFLSEDWMAVDFVANHFMGFGFPWHVSFRPPLNSFGLGLAFSLLGYSYTIAKLYSAFYIAPLAVVTYLLAGRLFDSKTALLSSLLLVCLNPIVLSMGFDVHVYHVAAYFSFCFLYLWVRRVHWFYLAVGAGALYLMHPICVVFMGVLFLYEVYRRGWGILDYADVRVAYFIVVALVVASPWLIRNHMVFGNPFYTTGRHVMFYRVWEDHFRLNPPTASSYISYISDPKNLILVKGGSVAKTMIPPPYSFTYSRFQPLALIDPIALQYCVAGILTYPLFFVCLYYALRQFNRLVPFLFWGSLIAAMVLFGLRHDYERSLMFPEVLLLGVYGLSKVKENKKILALIVLFIVFQSTVLYIHKIRYQPDLQAYEWIRENTSPESIIMSRRSIPLNYATQRRTVVTPNEGRHTITDIIRAYRVDVYAVHRDDLRLRELDLDYLNQTFMYEGETEEFWFYRTSA